MTGVSLRDSQPPALRSPARSSARVAVAGVALGVGTFVAYLPGIGRSLDFDSAQTIGDFIRPGPPWSVFRHQEVFNNHPLFSFLEQIVRVVTGRTDAATMRVLPITLGAVAVGVLTWYCARRFGILAGVVAGIVFASNPTFVELSRSVRGYSLLSLCALVSTIVLIDDLAEPRVAEARSWVRDAVYIAAAGFGLATHLFMAVVLVVHVAVVFGTRRFDRQWRERFLAVMLLGALAYVAMVTALSDASAAHDRVFQLGLPWDVIKMVLGDGWAAIVLAPVAVLGLALMSKERAVRIALLASAGVFTFLWVVLQSSALSGRFFVFIVPGIGLLVAFAVARMSRLAVLALAAAALGVVSFAGSYRDDPTPYRQAGDLIRSVDRGGARTCVVDVGISAMRAYVDEGRDFTGITDPGQLDSCDVVVVAAYWQVDADWYARDRAVIAAARERFPVQTVFPDQAEALVFSSRPLASWTAPSTG